MVGATLACLLAQAGKEVAIVENYLPSAFDPHSHAELRVSAISRASQKAFQKVGAWTKMQAMRVSPYEAMHVWEETRQVEDMTQTATQPVASGEIHFDAADLGEPDLGHIIENKVIQLALLEVIRESSNVDLISPASLAHFAVHDDSVEVHLDNQQTLVADLLVGADGANSRVRELSNISLTKTDYAQQGLVATIKPELCHQSTAWQRFMPSGPLALLPLCDNHCSIVWTLPADKADYYLTLEDKAFNQALTEAFGNRLGQLEVCSKRAAFPLVGRHAERYVMPHIALVGDAAHTIHPLAGQGVNLGIKDAVALAEIISQSSRSPGSQLLLRRYERARKADNVLTQKAMEGFNILFSHSLPVVKTGRDLGLNLVNRLTPVKHQIIRAAMGI